MEDREGKRAAPEEGAIRFLLGGVLPRGEEVAPAALVRERADRFEAAERMLRSPGPGRGWMDLPDRDPEPVREAAAWASRFGLLVQIGIGGSALGNLALHQALLPDAGEGRFLLLDNPDPRKFSVALERIGDRPFALAVVSKSGATAESAIQFAALGARMEARSPGFLRNRTIVVTDPEQGFLRAFSRETGCRSLPIPSDVGGRYSVLSPVGLPSAAFLGIDPGRLLAGAARMREILLTRRGAENPAWVLAALHLHHAEAGRNMAVLMPYSSRLNVFCEWFAQLWGESLGKEGRGTTPVRALGAIDQHSQVQLYVDGPDDKFFTLMEVEPEPPDDPVPELPDALAPLGYLSGHRMGELMRLEARSTAAALERAGRPVAYLRLPDLREETLGGLLFFCEYLTALTGLAMGIDPFDQPGVEQGKRYAYGLLGRPGYEEAAREVRERTGRIESLEIDA